jgi:hypothetical protein
MRIGVLFSAPDQTGAYSQTTTRTIEKMRVPARKRSETLRTDWKKNNIGTGSVQTVSFSSEAF